MTEPHPCNCESCDNSTCDLSNANLERAKKEEILSVGRIMTMRCTTSMYGCLSHTRAREVLMKDVVEELEQQIVSAKKERNHERAEGYKKAIVLIRGKK